MNDRCLFRGKRIDRDLWVVGHYFMTPLTVENFGAGHLGDMAARHCISDEYGVVYAVIPETICQCTGMKDKNNRLIFEKDIVTASNYDGQEFIVNYKDYYFSPFGNYGKNEWEIIGYTYDRHSEVK